MTSVQAAIGRAALGAVETPEAGAFVRRYCFPEEFIGFAGHFPGHPVLPAVVQVLTAEDLIRAVREGPVRLGAVEGAKFLREIGPDQEVEVAIRTRLARGRPVYDCRLTLAGVPAAAFLWVPAEEPT